MARVKKEGDVEAVELTADDRIAKLEQLVSAQADSLLSANSLIAELRTRVDRLGEAVHALEKDNPKGITASAPVPLTGDEVTRLCADKPAAVLVVLDDYRPANLRRGDRFEVRHRFASVQLLASHIAGGLRVVEAA